MKRLTVGVERRRNVNYRLPPDLIAAVGHRAIEEGYGSRASFVVEDALRIYLKRKPHPDRKKTAS